MLAGGHGIHGESQSTNSPVVMMISRSRFGIGGGGREHTWNRLTHLWLCLLKWWRASWGCDPCSSDPSYSCQIHKVSILLLGPCWWSGSLLHFFSSVSRPRSVHCCTEPVLPQNKVESQHSAPSPALSVDENTNSVLLKHYRYTGTSWPGDGGRERINWTLASAQHDWIKLGAQHDWIKLGRIPI